MSPQTGPGNSKSDIEQDGRRSVFISHSSANADQANLVCAALERAGISCWIAPRDIEPGWTFASAIVEAIKQCDLIVMLLSSESNRSRHVKRELEIADDNQTRILPVFLEKTELDAQLGYYLNELQRLEAYERPLQEHVPQIVKSASRLLSSAQPWGPVDHRQDRPKPDPDADVSAAPTPNNLPAVFSSFIGREAHLAVIRQKLPSSRLITLHGPGGCGKTRLAIRAAGSLLSKFIDGVWFVQLGTVTDPQLIAQAIATEALTEQPDQKIDMLTALKSELKAKVSLLVLDNCEHLIADCAILIGDLLGACPDLSIICTSRAALNVFGESVVKVDPFSVPMSLGDSDLSLGSLSKYESVRLFVERAQEVAPTFIFREENARAVARICRQLEGIPLALELASAWVKSLSVSQISERLERSISKFRVLSSRGRASDPKHATLEATIDWSYRLLTEKERLLLLRVAIFNGGWLLEAAEAICSDESAIDDFEVMDLLRELVDKSLVQVRETEQVCRYTLLETLREYCCARLGTTGIEESVAARHRAYFLTFATEAEARLTGPEQAYWLARYVVDHDNLRSAIEGCQASERFIGDELRFCSALWRFWYMRSYVEEGVTRLRSALGRAGGDLDCERASACLALATLLYVQTKYNEAEAMLREAKRLFEIAEDAEHVADSTMRLGLVVQEKGDLELAKKCYEDSLKIYEQIGQDSGIANATQNLGSIAVHQGELELAESYYGTGLAAYRRIGDISKVALSLSNLSNVTFDQGKFSLAMAQLEESLTICNKVSLPAQLALLKYNIGRTSLELGDVEKADSCLTEALELATATGDNRVFLSTLEAFGTLACMEEELGRACRLWGATAKFRESLGIPLGPNDKLRHEARCSEIRAKCGDQFYSREWAEGQKMTLEEVSRYVIAFHPSEANHPR